MDANFFGCEVLSAATFRNESLYIYLSSNVGSSLGRGQAFVTSIEILVSEHNLNQYTYTDA